MSNMVLELLWGTGYLPTATKKVSSTKKPVSVSDVKRIEDAKRKLKHRKKAVAQPAKASKAATPKSASAKSTKSTKSSSTTRTPKAASSAKSGRHAAASSKKDKKSRSRSRSAPQGGTNPLIFAVAGIAITGAIVIGIFLSQDSPKADSTPATPVQAQRTNEEPVRRGGLKQYSSRDEAPKGVVLYYNKQTRKYEDPSALPPSYQTRYSKNTNIYRRVQN